MSAWSSAKSASFSLRSASSFAKSSRSRIAIFFIPLVNDAVGSKIILHLAQKENNCLFFHQFSVSIYISCYTMLMNQKSIFIISIIIFSIILAFFFWPSSRDITNYPPKDSTIVAFGDSLVVGVGSTQGQDFVSLLSTKIRQPIVNLGVSGNTTADALNRIGDIDRYNPGIVFVLLGGNDYLRKIPINQTFSNLEKIIDRLQSQGAVVVLLGVQGGIIGDPYEDRFEDLADLKHTIYVPNILDGLVLNSKYMSDSVHPNDVGYAKIADKIHKEIKDYVGL